jgi:hypothetical protein
MINGSKSARLVIGVPLIYNAQLSGQIARSEICSDAVACYIFSSFSLGFHKLISGLSPKGRWATQDITACLFVRCKYDIILLLAFFTILKPSLQRFAT